MAYLSPVDERRRRIMDAMQASLQSPQQPAPGVNFPAPNTNLQTPDISQVTQPNQSVPESSPDIAARPVRIGYSTAGLTGVDKLIEKRKALEDASPESNVNVTSDFTEIEPPKHRHGIKGRLKSIGEGVLTGLAMADPDNPNAILGSAIGGGGLGAVSPRGEAKLHRRFETLSTDNDIARGLKLEQEQAQIGGLQALRHQRELEPQIQAAKLDQERELANQKLEIERQKAAGLITKNEADRQQRELDRQSREKTNAASNEARIEAARISAGGRTNSNDVRQRKGEAAQAELEQLVSDEQKAGEEKNRAYDYLTQLKTAVGLDGKPAIAKEDIAEATRAAEEANKVYQSFAEKKRDAQTRVRENTLSTPSTSAYSGRTMSQANLQKYATDKGISVDEARKTVEAQGVRIQ